MKSFDELHMKLKDRLQCQFTLMRECIQPIQMLAVAANLFRKTATNLSKINRHPSTLYQVKTETEPSVCERVDCFLFPGNLFDSNRNPMKPVRVLGVLGALRLLLGAE